MEKDFSAIEEEEICVLTLPVKGYEDAAVELAGHVLKQFESVCYVTLNEPVKKKRESFEKAGIPLDKFLFIDGVTKADDAAKKEVDNCVFVGSQNTLTDLNIAIEKSLETRELEVLVFDSLSTLLLKHDREKVAQFAQKIATAAKAADMTVVLPIAEGEEEKELVKDLGMFVDEITEDV